MHGPAYVYAQTGVGGREEEEREKETYRERRREIVQFRHLTLPK